MLCTSITVNFVLFKILWVDIQVVHKTYPTSLYLLIHTNNFILYVILAKYYCKVHIPVLTFCSSPLGIAAGRVSPLHDMFINMDSSLLVEVTRPSCFQNADSLLFFLLYASTSSSLAAEGGPLSLADSFTINITATLITSSCSNTSASSKPVNMKYASGPSVGSSSKCALYHMHGWDINNGPTYCLEGSVLFAPLPQLCWLLLWHWNYLLWGLLGRGCLFASSLSTLLPTGRCVLPSLRSTSFAFS